MSTDIYPVNPHGKGKWLLYGANGYTGRLIAEEAVRQGSRPVLAGRNQRALTALSAQLHCECRIFDLTDSEAIRTALSDIKVVMHCAGPFSATAQPMAEACIREKVHYMDITGEFQVLEYCYTLHDAAASAGVTMIPGSGFDVVPTDCIAVHLKESMPDATRLRLAFAGKLTKSPGTWRATLEAIPRCGLVRKEGVLVKVPHAWKSAHIDFDDKRRSTMTIPWGDISSAWRSTGIRDIEVYGGAPQASIFFMKAIRGFACKVTSIPRVHQVLDSMIRKSVKGPDEYHRKNEVYHLRGDVWNDHGDQITRFMQVPEGYTCTVWTTLGILDTLLDGELPPGVWTPAQVMGSGYAERLPGFKVIEVREK